MRALIPLSVLQSTSIPCFALRNAPAIPWALALPHAPAHSRRDPVARGPRMAFQPARSFSAASPVATVMTPEQKYLFDLNGFIVIRGVLSPEEIKAANDAIDAHTPEFKERAESALRNTRVGTPLAGDGRTPRLDMGGMLGWQKPHCDIFRKMLCHPKLVPYLKELVGEDLKGVIVQPETKAGDVILFSEGTVHGAAPWNMDYQRRLVLYRFAPSFIGYGRAYTNDYAPRWPQSYYEGASEEELAVLEPPYNVRLDRPLVTSDGESVGLEVKTRSQAKKEFDQRVFSTKYF